MKRIGNFLLVLLVALVAVLIVPSSIAPVHAVNTFQTCDLFAGIGNGRIAWWRPNACGIPSSMTFQGLITAPIPNREMTGMGFNNPSCGLGPGHPCLYATMFDSQAVSIFDNTGVFLGTCGAGYSSDPESIVIDTTSSPGAIYVGQADVTHHILKFNLDCTPGTLPFFAPATEARGTDWIDLVAPDSVDGGALCDVQYTSEATHVLTFDICSNSQESNLNTAPLPGRAFAHRQLTIDHSVLVGDSQLVVHLDSSGTLINTCDSSSGILFALNVLPGSKEFVTADIFSGKTDYFTVSHCDAGHTTPDFTFNAIPTGCTGICEVAGLAVFGEATSVSQPRTTSTAVVCNPSTVAVNQATSCTATVTDTSSGPPTAPTGVVSFSSSASGMFSSINCPLAPISSSASSCSVNYTPNPGSEGTHTITGTYGGDSLHSGSSGTFDLTVTKRSTMTGVNCIPGTVLVDASTTCTAAVTDTSPGIAITPSGTVSWSSSSPGVFTPPSCVLSGAGAVATCSVTYTPSPGSEGVTTITATYSGDTDHFGSSGSTTITVTMRPTMTTVNCSPGTVPVNAPTSCTATVTDTGPGMPIAPTGSVSFTSSGSGTFSPPSCGLTPINSMSSQCSVTYKPNPGSEGVHTITATYGGDSNHSGSSGSFNLMVTKRTTSTSVGCTPNTVPVNSPTTCTATVTDTSPGMPIPPSGPVMWSSNGPGSFSPPTCSLMPIGPGTSACTVMYTPAPGTEGTQIIKAMYNGDTDHFGSTGSTPITVTKRPTNTTVNCTPGSVPVNAPTTCTATVNDIGPGMPTSPMGSVSFTSSGSGLFSSGVCTLTPISSSASQCSVTYTPNPGSEGTHVITGTYGGDIDHFGSSGSFNLTVTKRTTTTSVSCSPGFVQPGVSTTCQATVTDTSPGTPIAPTGTVTWTSNSAGTFSPSASCTLTPVSASSSTCTVTYTPTVAGDHLITATYGGDTDHSGSSGSTDLFVGIHPKSAVTDSSLCHFDTDPNTFGQQFNLIYIQDSHNPGTYELVTSNPGQFYYNVFYNGPAGSPVTLQIRIPYPFVTHGANPIQEFGQVGFTSQGCFVPSDQLSGFTNTPSTVSLSSYFPQAMGSFVTITVSGTVPSTGLVYVTIHLEYGFKGVNGYTDVSNNAVNSDSTKNVPQLQSYTFSFNTVVGVPQSDSQTVQSENIFKGCAKGFCGMVMDSTGTPISGTRVQVFSSTGQLISTVQTDVDGFYTIPYTLLGTNLATFTIAVPSYNLTQTVTLALNTFTVTNFTTP